MENISSAAQSLWGKKSISDDNEYLWLPLIVHMIDTKNVINYLYNQYLDNGQRNILKWGFADTDDVQNLVKFMGYIHDIGKATPIFQSKPSFFNNSDLDYALMDRLVDQGFKNIEEDAEFYDYKNTPHAQAGEVILEERGLNETLGAIIGGHHGRPQEKTFNHNENYRDYSENYLESEEDQKKWKSVQDELINYGLKLCNISNLSDLPEISEEQAVILNGLVIMADWLASSFPLIDIDQQFPDDMEERWQNGVLSWKKNTNKWSPDLITNPDELYKERFGFTPRSVQHTMSKAINDSVDPGMIIIEAPMGIGKTEIALNAVEQLAKKTGRNQLFFGLPTQATANAMFNRVEKWLGNIAKQDGEDLQIKLMHGKAQFNEEYRNLPQAKDIEDQDSEGTVVVNSWFSGKKSMLSDFTIGTIDHLLLMGLKQKHLMLRHLGLSGKIVVIDEVHAYDTYMNSYLERTIKWLGAYGVPVIALSATLPISRRNKLLTAYAEGKYGSVNIEAPDDWEHTQAYPLLSILNGNKLSQTTDFDISNQKPRKVSVKRINLEDDALVKNIYQKIENGGVAGVIVNTVKRAQTLAELAKNYFPDVKILLLHSAFLATDRANLEEKLQKLIGKDGDRPERLIVFGTQVLEQSLDIDFDVLFTDIAPMDLLLQRTGRLHRHEIRRPSALVKPQLYVMGINSFGDYGDANEAVYDKYLLAKTDYFLTDDLILPNDISSLVQKVYESNKVSKIEELYDEFKDKQEKEQTKAQAFQISDPGKLKNLHGWLDYSQSELTDNQAQAAVRDIQESIEVILLQHTDEGDFLLNKERTNINDLSELERDQTIARQIIRLPHALTLNITKSINQLETITQKYYKNWENSPWLKGSIALPLDSNFETIFNDYRVKYSTELGLSYEKI